MRWFWLRLRLARNPSNKPGAIESEKCDRNVSRHTYACFERRQLVPLVRHGDGIIL